jgi:hypothetical protein
MRRFLSNIQGSMLRLTILMLLAVRNRLRLF